MIQLCPLGEWRGSSWELRSQKRDELAKGKAIIESVLRAFGEE